MASGTVDSSETVTTSGDDHDGRDVRDVTIVLVVIVVIVAIAPEARQPSVVVHSEQAPRYPFCWAEGKKSEPAKQTHPYSQGIWL